MKLKYLGFFLLAATAMFTTVLAQAVPLGLPPVPIPADNPQTPEKIKLGDRLFHDKRFSSTSTISCATCHDKTKTFTDSPLSVSEGINGLTGTRNSPTVVNSAYLQSQFWDGREPDLESQAGGPFINPVEMGLKDYTPIINVIKNDSEYLQQFKTVFGVGADGINIDHVKKAIASFERTVISGDSPFDKHRYGGDETAMSEAAKRGLDVFVGQGRCVSCHTIFETHALFTDNRFYNLGIGFDQVDQQVQSIAAEFTKAKKSGASVDVEVLSNPNTAELGRFVVTGDYRDIGAFRTPILRNVEVTDPYMHDGSLQTLKDVVEFYNLGGLLEEGETANSFQSGGIRPLNLSDQQKDDLVEFLNALTSPEYKQQGDTK